LIRVPSRKFAVALGCDFNAGFAVPRRHPDIRNQGTGLIGDRAGERGMLHPRQRQKGDEQSDYKQFPHAITLDHLSGTARHGRKLAAWRVVGYVS
jgi:hypothetical protein